MIKLVLLRHGESVWNKENRFTGWADVDLSETGIEEARNAAEKLKKNGYVFDAAFTSLLKRGVRTLWIVLDQMDLMWIPVKSTWRLNERHYGALTGLNKSEMAEKYGEEQVKIWRRSYSVRPPAAKGTPKDSRYSGVLVPKTECLKDVVARVVPYWKKEILPELKKGKKVIIAAHGNSIRALVKYIDNVPDSEISEFNVPTGIPLVYEFDKKMKPKKHYFLASEEELKAALDKVANQGRAK